MQTFAPETEYLCDLARAWSRGVVGTVPPAVDLDQDRFVRLLAGQPAMQALVRYLDPSVLTAEERAQMERAVDISRRRTTMMLLELERVLPGLAAVDCRPVVLKGASLALTVYDAPEDRWFVDLDLLVEPRHLSAVYGALEQLGYHFVGQPRIWRYYEKYHFHRVLMSTQGVCIEVHWAVTLPNSVYEFDVEVLRGSAQEVALGEVSLLAPQAVDQILHGVLQSIPAGYGDLRRILDLHRLDAVLDERQQQAMCERARGYNLSTGLWLQYQLRETILGPDIPAVVDQLCRPSSAVVRIFDGLDLAAGCLERNTTQGDGFERLIHWLCVPANTRAREVRRFVWPSEETHLEVEMRTGKPVTARQAVQLMMERLLTTGRAFKTLARASI